eukprot:Nitzschia sp. Nitz4//scaffold22_size323478//192982//195967//NITZ4_000553-RA/size323478-augustus-gene-0.206-mRNA-1//1//CDS//3329543073//39//frame0
MMRQGDYNQALFERKVSEALKTVQRILDVNRNPRLAGDVDHFYEDKYSLANTITNTALIAQLQVLQQFGLTLETLQTCDHTKPLTLRFQASDSCSFLKEQVVKVPGSKSVQTNTEVESRSSLFGSGSKSTITQVVQHVTEYHWKVDVSWEVSLYTGTDIASKKVLDSRTSSTTLVIQSNKKSPLPQHRDANPIEVSLTWLLQQLDVESKTSKFRIDVDNKDTKTPRRNQDVIDAIDFMKSLSTWAKKVGAYLQRRVQKDIVDKHNPTGPKQPDASRLDGLSSDTIFVPFYPFLAEIVPNQEVAADTDNAPPVPGWSLTSPSDGTRPNDQTRVLSSGDLHKFLNEQMRSIREKLESLQRSFPARPLNKLVSSVEATFVVLCDHVARLEAGYRDCMNYIESLLESQLVAAIGKRVQSEDIDEFVRYYYGKFLDPAPRSFCQSIRRPGFYPDGIVSIEAMDSKEKWSPVETFAREVAGGQPVQMALNDATTVELTGKTYVHGYIQHRFGPGRKEHKLIARARQFSSFMLVVGVMAGPNRLDPKDAIIVQNKDEVFIPLLFEELPTSKEFKDAIQSLSPEQQRFAKAFRSMQLSTSVLGLCVIQIKPQLETLLGLPQNGLTKEMKLTQDLMSLFIDYQVPSDLLSFDDMDEAVADKDKVKVVKDHVKAVLDVIVDLKTKQLEAKTLEADMAWEQNTISGRSEDSVACYEGELPKKPHRMLKAMSSRPRGALPAPPQMMAMPMVAAGLTTLQTDDANDGFDAMRARSVPPGEVIEEACFDEAGPPEAPPGPNLNEARQNMETSPSATVGGSVDVTQIPKLLDSTIERHSSDSALRTTVIKTGEIWERKHQENLLVQPETKALLPPDVNSEKNKTFDLLDALSRSGSLSIPCSELHVLVSMTHCFEKDVMHTIIEDNVNPIEKLEKSVLLMASVIHGQPPRSLLRSQGDCERLQSTFPELLDAPEL